MNTKPFDRSVGTVIKILNEPIVIKNNKLLMSCIVNDCLIDRIPYGIFEDSVTIVNYLILIASRRESIVHKTLLNCISCYKAKQLKLLRKQFYQTEQQLQSLNSLKDETILQKSNVLHYNDNSSTLLDER